MVRLAQSLTLQQQSDSWLTQKRDYFLGGQQLPPSRNRSPRASGRASSQDPLLGREVDACSAPTVPDAVSSASGTCGSCSNVRAMPQGTHPGHMPNPSCRDGQEGAPAFKKGIARRWKGSAGAGQPGTPVPGGPRRPSLPCSALTPNQPPSALPAPGMCGPQALHSAQPHSSHPPPTPQPMRLSCHLSLLPSKLLTLTTTMAWLQGPTASCFLESLVTVLRTPRGWARAPGGWAHEDIGPCRVCKQQPWRSAHAFGGRCPWGPLMSVMIREIGSQALSGGRRCPPPGWPPGKEGSVPGPPALASKPVPCVCLPRSWPAATLPLKGRMLSSPAAGG